MNSADVYMIAFFVCMIKIIIYSYIPVCYIYYVYYYLCIYVYIAHAGKGLILLGIGNFNHGATKACGLHQVCIQYCSMLYIYIL